MPNRWIRESCRTSKNLAQVSDRAERLFWRLTTCADDFGRFLADPEVIKAQCFTYRRNYLISYVQPDLKELVIHRLITIYMVKDRQYGQFCTWEEHQGKPRAKYSKYPDIPTDSPILHTDVNNCVHMRALSGSDSDSKSISSSSLPPNGKGESERKGKRPIGDDDKPTEKHFSLGQSLGIEVGPEWGKFKNYCLAHDKRYANFEAAFRNWMANAAEMKGARHGLR